MFQRPILFLKDVLPAGDRIFDKRILVFIVRALISRLTASWLRDASPTINTIIDRVHQFNASSSSCDRLS